MSGADRTELTRKRLDAALLRFKGGTYNAEHLRVVVTAARRLAAMKPASDRELLEMADEWNDEHHASEADDETLYAYQDGIRAAERRLLLPFTDEPPGDGR
jgi:hypothetical protein